MSPQTAYLLEFVEDVGTLAVAQLRADGTVARANRGFRRLFGEEDADDAGPAGAYALPDPEGTLGPGASWLLAPSFDELVRMCLEGPYLGLLTVGFPDTAGHTLRGSVRRHGDGWLLAAEHDVEAIERLSSQVLRLNDDLAERQRELARANRLLRQREQHLVRLSYTDELTGLPNRRRFMERLEHEAARSTRRGTALSVAMIDLDDFKSINDEHGHPAGDRVLQATAEALRTGLRLYDMPSRLGGDEFAAILFDAGQDEARAVGERVRRALAETLGLPGGLRLRASIGVSSYLANEDDGGEQLLSRADQALYRAKRQGGDRVEAEDAPA